MSEIYRFVWRGGTGELTEKKSRFIASVAPASSEEQAAAFIEKIKKQYRDARHNCSAYTIGEGHRFTHCSDDGEPAGTAGRPMLDVLLGEDIHDTAAVVTRYFGGTLLGTGGLVRAYSGALRAGLSGCIILEKQTGLRLRIHTDYTDLGKIQNLLSLNRLPLLDSSYTDTVILETLVPLSDADRYRTLLRETTFGRADPEDAGVCSFAVSEGKTVILTEAAT